MSFRTLGHSGLKVSVAGLGTNNFGQRIPLEKAREVIDAALDHGINFFDTADVYGGRGGSETAIGEVLGTRRNRVVLATKFGNTFDAEARKFGASRSYIIEAVEGSLKRLRTDWIDLYQIHRPDPQTPIEETLRALDHLVTSGKVRYIGLSNYAAWQVTDAQWVTRYLGLGRLISAQDEYSLVNRKAEAELLPALEAAGLGLLPYLPLAGGLLTGKYQRGAAPPAGTRFAEGGPRAGRFFTEANFTLVEKLTLFAQERDHSLADLALAWLAAQRLVGSVIAGATSAAQVAANVKSLEWQLCTGDLAAINALLGDTAA
jgi:aryl-alcohol dehydrogenase-like predicted oxidoreductase